MKAKQIIQTERGEIVQSVVLFHQQNEDISKTVTRLLSIGYKKVSAVSWQRSYPEQHIQKFARIFKPNQVPSI